MDIAIPTVETAPKTLEAIAEGRLDGHTAVLGSAAAHLSEYKPDDKVSAFAFALVREALTVNDGDDASLGRQHPLFLMAVGLVRMVESMVEAGEYPGWLDRLGLVDKQPGTDMGFSTLLEYARERQILLAQEANDAHCGGLEDECGVEGCAIHTFPL